MRKICIIPLEKMYSLNLGVDLKGLGLHMHDQEEEDGIEMVTMTLVCASGICWFKICQTIEKKAIMIGCGSFQ